MQTVQSISTILRAIPIGSTIKRVGSGVWYGGNALFSPTIDQFRIDESVRTFYKNRSWENAAGVGIMTLQIVLCSYVVHRLGIFNVLPGMILSNFLISYSPKNSQSFSSYFPLHKAVEHIGLGIVAGWGAIHLGSYVIGMVNKALESRGISLQNGQTVVILFQTPGVLGVFFSLMGVSLIPLSEEVLFRGRLLDDAILQKQNNAAKKDRYTTSERFHPAFKTIKDIIRTSLLFGLLHASWSQKWSNVLRITHASLLGGICGLLKVMTGDLWAPLAVHVFNNAVAMAHLYGYKPLSIELKPWKWYKG